uniref:Pre-mRNA splicing Prp18-interacting factor n=1 Tax=Tanacetum cinerariifolium TaxID=118510 RepID=A0A699GR33_TANCI|nr:hypothetical protein [Tanacetum cinerariifolium]
MCINCTYGDGKPVTCCVCEGSLRKAENSFTYDPNAYFFNVTSSNFNHLPQPQYETYLCELCGNDSHYGYDCQPQFRFIYEQEPSYNQNYYDNYYSHNSSSSLCCNNCGGSHEYLESSSNTIAASNLNQEKEGPPQDSDIRQLISEECCIKDCREQKKNMEDTMLELIEVVKNVAEQSTERRTLHAITSVLSNEEPEYSLSMGYDHLSTTSETESDEVTKSSVKNLLPIPSEYEDTSEDKRECDVPVCKDSSTFYVCKEHSDILSHSNDDDISSDGDAFEGVEYVEASPLDSELVSLEGENVVCQEDEEFDLEDILQIQDVILREKLLSINRLIADIESLNDNPILDRVLNSSTSIPIFEESVNSFSNNSLLEFKTFSDHTDDTRSGSTTAHANNSLPEYDLFCFEIEPDQERLTSGIGNIDYDSERDIYFLEKLLVDNSIPIPESESSDFDHQDGPLFLCPPPEPPDVEFFFDLEHNSGEVIAAGTNNIDELNEDECFDPGGEINVFANVEDDDFFSFIFVIRIFLSYLIYPEDSPLLLSAGNKTLFLTLTSPFRAGGISLG